MHEDLEDLRKSNYASVIRITNVFKKYWEFDSGFFEITHVTANGLVICRASNAALRILRLLNSLTSDDQYIVDKVSSLLIETLSSSITGYKDPTLPDDEEFYRAAIDILKDYIKCIERDHYKARAFYEQVATRKDNHKLNSFIYGLLMEHLSFSDVENVIDKFVNNTNPLVNNNLMSVAKDLSTVIDNES